MSLRTGQLQRWRGRGAAAGVEAWRGRSSEPTQQLRHRKLDAHLDRLPLDPSHVSARDPRPTRSCSRMSKQPAVPTRKARKMSPSSDGPVELDPDDLLQSLSVCVCRACPTFWQRRPQKGAKGREGRPSRSGRAVAAGRPKADVPEQAQTAKER